MPTLYQQISEKFLAKLAGRKEFEDKKIDLLRALLADSQKLKAEDFVKVFSGAVDDEIK